MADKRKQEKQEKQEPTQKLVEYKERPVNPHAVVPDGLNVSIRATNPKTEKLKKIFGF